MREKERKEGQTCMEEEKNKQTNKRRPRAGEKKKRMRALVEWMRKRKKRMDEKKR